MVTTRAHLKIASAVVAIVLAGCSRSANSPSSASLKPDKDRKTAPNFTLKDSNGSTVQLVDFKGKVVLLNFWATWCGPCQIEIPWFVEFEQKYKDQGFAVLGVSMDDDGWKSVKPYISSHKMNYPVVIGSDDISKNFGPLLNAEPPVSTIESLPSTFILDRDGRIASSHVGLVDKADYQNEIVALLAGKQASLRDAAGVFAMLVRPTERR